MFHPEAFMVHEAAECAASFAMECGASWYQSRQLVRPELVLERYELVFPAELGLQWSASLWGN